MITKEQAEKFFYQSAMERRTYKVLEKENNITVGSLYNEMKCYRGYFGIREKERYCKMTYLRYKYGDIIKQKYLDGQSTISLAKEYNYNDHGIAKLLESLDVNIRSCGYQSKIDQTIFSKIDTPEKAYLVGLLTADGSVNKGGGITICLTESDRYLLDEINTRILDGTGVVFLSHKEEKKPRVVLSFNGKQLCRDLTRFGIVPKKTYSLLSLSSEIPTEFYPDYIRGLYDGDGVCSKSNGAIRIGYCAYNKEFTESYQNYLCEKLGMRKNKLFNTGSCWQCSWAARNDLEKFYHYLYGNNPTLYLVRKEQKLGNFIF